VNPALLAWKILLRFQYGSFHFAFKTTKKSSFCAKRSVVAESMRRIFIRRRMDSATSRGMTANIFVALKWKSNQPLVARAVGWDANPSMGR